ncbi:MAG TPA: S41 family peptidase [candidate division Zixibacteria bacterium]
MSEIKMKSSTFVLLFVVIVLLVLIFNTTYRFVSIGRISGLDRVASLISSSYVDRIAKEKVIKDGITGMVADLDPYSEYLDKKELSGLLEESKGEFQGIGLEIAIRDGYPTVVSPLEGSPAYKAGINAGDRIIEINGISTEGLSGEGAQQKIRGPKGSKVKMTIVREGIAESLEFNLIREVIEIRSVAFAGEIVDKSSTTRREEGIGYIRLIRFSENAPGELSKALADLKTKNITGLILDLRGNPGGLLPEAVGVTELFLEKGELIVKIKGRKASDTKKFYSQVQPVFDSLPLIVLVNYGSASASEIVSGAIQDQDRGLVLGDTTFGKGAVQTLFELANNTALKLTTAKYYIPSGRLIQKEFSHNKNPTTDTTEIVDSLKNKLEEKVYYTKKGRKVYGGGGIVPDMVIPDLAFPPLVQDLLQKQLFFDFAIHYTSSRSNSTVHKNIPEDFQADDKVLKEFKDFIKSKGFEYKTATESELEKLKATIKEEKGSEQVSNAMKETLNGLNYLIEKGKEADFEKNKELLKWQIEEAIMTKEFGSSTRYKVWAKYQEQIKKAIEILKNKEEYERLLSSP